MNVHIHTVENLIYAWARAIDEDRVEAIASLLCEEGRYTVKSRFNHDRGFPMAIIDCHSPAQLRDRILSMRIANIYAPQHYRHILSGVQIVGESQDEGGSKILQVRSNYLVVRTMELDGDMKIISTGQCQDEVVLDANTAEGAQFKSRLFLYDSRVIETLLIIPI
jgi:anthranilate 1,2-dioxygenase small subunit